MAFDDARSFGKSRRRLLHAVPALLMAGLLLGTGCMASRGAAEGVAAPAPRHTLWRVEAETGSGTAYLLGSLHLVRREDVYPLPEVITSAFEAAAVTAFELDLDAAQQGAARMVQRGMLEGGRTLAEVIPDSTGRLLRTRLDSSSLSILPFRRMEPWLVSTALPAAVLQGSGYTSEAGLDAYFFEQAKAAGKERVALETLDDQIAVFDSLPVEAQNRLLHATLRTLDQTPAYIDTLVAAWKAGDPDALDALVHRGLRRHPVLRRRILTDRNRRWVPQIEHLLTRADTSFVVVGAGHLVGEGSVVERLRRRGYRVVQL